MLVSHLCSLCWDANFVVLIHANWKNASTCQPGAPALPHYIPPIALALASHQSDATTLICPRFPTRPTAWPPVFPTLRRALPEIGSGERPSPPLTWYTQLAPSLTSYIFPLTYSLTLTSYLLYRIHPCPPCPQYLPCPCPPFPCPLCPPCPCPPFPWPPWPYPCQPNLEHYQTIKDIGISSRPLSPKLCEYIKYVDILFAYFEVILFSLKL